MMRGESAPASITDAVFEDAIRRIPRSSGFILDGYPRIASQIEEAYTLLQRCGRRIDRVVLLEAPVAVLAARLANRQICTACRHVSALTVEVLVDICENCGAQDTLEQRQDDQNENTRSYRAGLSIEKELIDHYEKRDLLWRVDATQTIDLVASSIFSSLQRSVTHSAQVSAYELLQRELMHPKADNESVIRAVKSWLPLSLEENIHKRTGKMRRFVAVVSNNPWKINEYVRFFDQYGIEVLGVPRLTCEGPFASVAMHALLVSCRTKLVVPLGVLREFSNLFKPRNVGEVGRNEYSSLRDGVSTTNIAHLTYWISPNTAPDVIERFDVRQLVNGHIDRSKRSGKSTISPVFAWDDIFVVAGSGKSYCELAAAGHKVSARDRVMSKFVRDHVHYRKPKNLHHFPLQLQRVVDFGATVEKFVEKNTYFTLPEVQRFGIGHMLGAVLDQGIFFRASANRRQLTYWLPSLNAGLPLTAKADPVHELTYMMHDLFHFRMPDLTPLHRPMDVAPEEAAELRSIYVAYRMMSEAITIVLADGVFIEALQRSFALAPELANYDFAKRRIYPLFTATGLLKEFAPDAGKTVSQRVAILRKLLYANVQYVLKGRDGAFRELLAENPDCDAELANEVLNGYKAKYSPFFAEDYRWTMQNHDHMVDHGDKLAQWWTQVGPIRSSITCESVQDFRTALNNFTLGAGEDDDLGDDMVDKIFQFVFERDVVPSLFAKEAVTSEREGDARSAFRLKQAFLRYMTGQMYIFARFAQVAPRWLEEQRVALMQSLTEFQQMDRSTSSSEVLAKIAVIREMYDATIDMLADGSLISPDDAVTYKEVHPIFPAFFVSYDHHAEENASTLQGYYRSVFGEVALEQTMMPAKQKPSKRYTTTMSSMIRAGGGELQRIDDVPASGHITIVIKPGVLLLATSMENSQISAQVSDDRQSLLNMAKDSSSEDEQISMLDGCRSCTFLLAGVSVETSLELIAHSEASVARLTTSRTSAMDHPLYTLDGDVPAEPQIEYIAKAVKQHQDFFDQRHGLRDTFSKKLSAVEERKSAAEWFNVVQPGNKATVLSYTMRLCDFNKLFIGRLPVAGNENGVRHVLGRVCDKLHSIYPHVIRSREEYEKGSNQAKYQVSSSSTSSSSSSSQHSPIPKQQAKQQAKQQSKQQFKTDYFLPPVCRRLFTTRLTDDAHKLIGELIPTQSSTDAEILAEFQSRLTYLAFPGEKGLASVTPPRSTYLQKMVDQYGHLSILSASHVVFELRLGRTSAGDVTASSYELLSRLGSLFKLHICQFVHEDHHIAAIGGSLKQWYVFVKSAAARRPNLGSSEELWLLNVAEAELSYEFPLLFKVPGERFACISHETTDDKWRDVLKELCQLAPYATFLNVYRFGSCNYGTAHAESDLDLMVVTAEDEFNLCAIVTPRYNINFYSKEHFAQRLSQQKICAIEAVEHPIVNMFPFEYQLNQRVLRSSIDHIVGYTLSKGEKKLLGGQLSRDTYVAKKQIFHAYRIAACAIELCKSGKVGDWSRWRHIYDNVMQLPSESPTQATWEHWKQLWKPKIDALMEEFHKLAPK
jgi:adenylate kinase family enzyme